MKKTFLLSVACVLASVCFGQSPYVIFDGEDEVNPWWNVGGATVEVVDWLQKDAVNSSDYGATIWRVNENNDWAGGGINLDLDISTYNKIAVDVLKKVEGTVQVELQNGDERAYLTLPYAPTGIWQTLVFDIPEDWTHLTTLLVVPHLVNTTENPIPDDDDENHRMSWDNVVAFYEETGTGVFIIPANTSRSADEYSNDYTDIIFESGGQLTDANNLSVNGAVKVVKTFDTDKWYPIGFPFAIENISIKQSENTYTGDIYALDNGAEVVKNPVHQNNATTENIYLAAYDGAANKFKFAGALTANTGYVIAIPNGTFNVSGTNDGSISSGSVEITFTASANTVLNSTASSFTVSDGYVLTANPNLTNATALSGANYYYEYDLATQHFDRISGGSSLNTDLKPFEALVVYKGTDTGAALRSSLGIDGTDISTAIEMLRATSDPVVETQYYNLQGVRITVETLRATPLQSGAYIERTVRQSGKSESKVVIKQVN